MKIQFSKIRKHDLNSQDPFISFLPLYNRIISKIASIVNRGILIRDNFSHQIEQITTSKTTIKFPKRISHQPILILLIQAKRNDNQSKQKTTSIKEWTSKENIFYISLEGLENTSHTLTFLIL